MEQAPPIGVILRFFLMVPFFGVLFSLFMFYSGSDMLVPHGPSAAAAVHLLFLGVIAMAMTGSLFQMLPVLAGVVIKVPTRHATAVHLLLTTGTMMLVWAFISFEPAAYALAGLLLGSAVFWLALLMLPPLLRQRDAKDTVRGMQIALASFAVAVLLALAMLYMFAQGEMSVSHEAIRASHYSFALVGWMGMLIIAVAFQVIEMFYVTPPYPGFCKKWAWAILFASLMLKMIWLIFSLPYAAVFDTFIAVTLLGFAVITFRRLSQRKRPVADATVWFWRMGMALLLLAVLGWFCYTVSGESALIPMMLVAYGGFALSVVFGMMYKIVPFLVWFHLNSQGYFDAPVMTEIISPKRAKLHVYLALMSFLFLFGSFEFDVLLPWAALAMLLSFMLLGMNLLSAANVYRRKRKSGTPMDLSAFSDMSMKS
ncbi:hypothetical protein WCX18_11110 [Sulfurimonas sp. HSL1-2]|uniref:hypothetical protein n=1 Tax=Thiomicrolovo zhangzhouensis TaxID=3131933 RepID=UPI0031F87F9C